MSGPRQEPPARRAGGVLWRADGADLQVTLVHRQRYDDWSLPKGKLRAGEHPLAGAVREVREETGCTGRVGRALGSVTYGPKTVDYWAMAATGGAFAASEEVDRSCWLGLPAAMERASYDGDRAVLRSFATVPAATTTVLLVRHGSAGEQSSWAGDDADRPLDGTGQQQARAVAELLPVYDPVRVIAAPRRRCVQSVAPLAERLQLPVQTDDAFTEEAHGADRARAPRLVRQLAGGGQPVAVCSQGGLIPDAVAALAERDGLTVPQPRSRKGSVWALHLCGGRLVAADYAADLGPQTPVQRTSRSAPRG